MTREDIIDGYMINEKHVIAEMLYDTITKYEKRITELEAPKSCDGCRNIGKLIDICCDCSRMWSDKFEPKDK